MYPSIAPLSFPRLVRIQDQSARRRKVTPLRSRNWHQALTFFVYRTEPVCQVLLLWSCLRKVFFEKLNEVYGGRRRILDAAHHEHDLPVILRHCGTAGHAVGILCEDQLPHISDTQIAFYQREDEVIIAAGVFHTWRNFISPKYAHMTKCIQCNQCALVCPHAAIRPVLLDENEQQRAPAGFETKKATGLAQYQYRMQVSPYDCTGCGSCVNICPAKEKALTMQPLESQLGQAENWEYAVETVTVKKDAVSDKTVKASQFAKPYFEFSGACAGCGETPYIKLVTQLFGDHMYITNASGCSSAYGGSTPSSPYCTDCKGCGPAWAMSLFEDNAEYAYGYLLGQDAIKRQLKAAAQTLADKGVAAEVCKEYIDKAESAAESRGAADALLAAVAGDKSDEAEFIRNNKEFLTKKSVWAFGGDGWAYDIGYGGLDHVLASGKNINVLMLDTEVYSNTGGQSSKATAAAAIAKFSAGGKVTKKKDLGLMAMSYGYVYVAQVAMGADPAQTLKAIREAEAYDGPSIVICYCPCIEHGMKASMGLSQIEEKKAVECGYWHLYRYDPRLKEQGKNPFQLDSKAPTGDFQQFLMGENRYASLKLSFPEKADALYHKAANDAKERYEGYVKLAKE